MSPNYRRVYAYNSNVFTYSRKQVWANEVGEQKLYKAIYLVSKWNWASQWNILLHWCAKQNSLSTRHFTSRL